MVGDEPVIEFNCISVRDDLKQPGVKAQKDYVEDKDLQVLLKAPRSGAANKEKDTPDGMKKAPAAQRWATRSVI